MRLLDTQYRTSKAVEARLMEWSVELLQYEHELDGLLNGQMDNFKKTIMRSTLSNDQCSPACYCVYYHRVHRA